jgi:ABC-type bacteriocin/lantibiotic exporter with double-glycine peptidase domain
VLELHDASFSWSDDSEPVLRDFNISLRKGIITAIIGSVGSGKSTFLESIMGETVLQKGSISPFNSTVAYCPQTPWIMNDTIRTNITGPESYDEKWYNFVIWACSLETDLQSIPGGDLSIAGTSGITLSGGQKQRIVRECNPVEILENWPEADFQNSLLPALFTREQRSWFSTMYSAGSTPDR